MAEGCGVIVCRCVCQYVFNFEFQLFIAGVPLDRQSAGLQILSLTGREQKNQSPAIWGPGMSGPSTTTYAGQPCGESQVTFVCWTPEHFPMQSEKVQFTKQNRLFKKIAPSDQVCPWTHVITALYLLLGSITVPTGQFSVLASAWNYLWSLEKKYMPGLGRALGLRVFSKVLPVTCRLGLA